MRRAGEVVREVLELVRGLAKPGATTMDLEMAAEARTNKLGAKPAFKGYHGFPCVLCTSINREVVHGIPSPKRVLKEGEIVSVDYGAFETVTAAMRPSPFRWARSTRRRRGC